MVLLDLPYGQTSLPFEAGPHATIAEPESLPAVAHPCIAVRDALTSPIGSPRLREIARGAQTATIVVNDITRPCPSQLLVEALLAELRRAEVPESGITLLVATGNHRPNTTDELRGMLGADICRRFPIVNHDASNPAIIVDLGETPRGVPVRVNRLVVETDLTILTGNIGPHQTAGYSGGRKSIMPGVASEFSLRTHHSYPIRSLEPVMGNLVDNHFDQEAVAAARIVGVDFIVNTVMNRRKEIVAVVAGDLEAAHHAGVAVCDAAWRVMVDLPADITVVTPGGYPKDIDLHQAQKAIASAELVTREGGPIVLVAECRDGTGKFAAALRKATNPQAVVDHFLAEGFEASEHTSKAYLFARAMLKHPIIVVSDRLDPADLAEMFLHWAPSPDAALASARTMVGPNPAILVAPHAVDTIFSGRETAVAQEEGAARY